MAFVVENPDDDDEDDPYHSSRIRFRVIENKQANTMAAVIQQTVLPGTRIKYDTHASIESAVATCNRHGMKLEISTYNKSGNLSSGCKHTALIEGLWGEWKRRLFS